MTLKRLALRAYKFYGFVGYEELGTGPYSAAERRLRDVQRMIWFLWEQKDGRRFTAEPFCFIHYGD